MHFIVVRSKIDQLTDLTFTEVIKDKRRKHVQS
jgi:hypothetical protein